MFLCLRALAHARRDFSSLALQQRPFFLLVTTEITKTVPRSASLAMTTKEKKTLAKWSNRTKANNILKDGLTDGAIDNNLKPKDISFTHGPFIVLYIYI
jgi:hypothetical protein